MKIEKKFLPFDFQMKKKGSGVVIEGFANANTVDRMKERIDPKGWELDNYKKNPIMLFDHGHDMQFGTLPIGRMSVVEAKEEGLYCKGQLSNSDSEKIKAVRDLVNEGILKTFSVGFAAKESKADATGEVNEITKAELIEISIVPVPMNQDSTFSLLSKRFSRAVNRTERIWLQQAMERATLSKKGAWVAAAAQQQIYNLVQAGELSEKSAVIGPIAELGGVSVDVINAVLSGDIRPVPLTVIDALAVTLKMDKGVLLSLDRGDQHKVISQEGSSMAKKPAPKKKSTVTPEAITTQVKMTEEDVKPDPKPEAPADAKAQVAKVGVQSVSCSKDVCGSAEDAATMVSEAGYKADQMEEDDVSYTFTQPGEFDMEAEGSLMDLGDGAVAKLMPLKSQPKSADVDEVKTASEDKKEEDDKMKEGEVAPELDKEQLAKLAADFKEQTEAAVAGGDANPPSWVADEAAWSKAKQVSEAALGEISYPFVVWYYLENGGGKKGMDAGATNAAEPDESAVKPEDESVSSDDSAQVKLLTEVVDQLKKVVEALSASKALGDKKPEEAEVKPEEDEAKKSFDILKRFNAEVDLQLKSLGC